MAKSIFIGGTGSNVGKSWMATALCRLLLRRGVRVAPFKAQNMSNNSFPCPNGGEIGRSQVAQAEACGLAPRVEMNPVLLKPTGDSRSQVILHGKVWRTIDAREYYRHSSFLRQEAVKAYERLACSFDVVVIEGAGSVAEINLWDRDFTNLSMARAVGARSLLVADIERGGVFASILGTLDLLPTDFRKLIRAFAVNRFRGDRSLFETGVTILEEKSNLPCLGVFPFAPGLHLDAEDSLAIPSSVRKAEQSAIVAVIRFPRISNSTDFRLLPHADWLDRPNVLQYRFIILPGTKSTMADLGWLRQAGLADWIVEQHKSGATIIGICGGYQMLGETIDDPQGVDGARGSTIGLGLVPVHTEMAQEKVTVQREACTPAGTSFSAYEIHMGRTVSTQSAQPFAILADGTHEGIRQNRVIGTYLHGALESPDVVAELFECSPPTDPAKHRHYDGLADWLQENASPGVLSELIDG